MSSASPQAQLLMSALAGAAQVAARRHGQQHEQAMAQLQHGRLAHLVDALVSQRTDAVKEGFVALLSEYAEQARHYMTQQHSFAEKELDCTEPLRRIELRSRINDIDTKLETIRADARHIYYQMTEVIRSLGGSIHDFARDLSEPLALPYTPSGMFER